MPCDVFSLEKVYFKNQDRHDTWGFKIPLSAAEFRDKWYCITGHCMELLECHLHLNDNKAFSEKSKILTIIIF